MNQKGVFEGVRDVLAHEGSSSDLGRVKFNPKKNKQNQTKQCTINPLKGSGFAMGGVVE